MIKWIISLYVLIDILYFSISGCRTSYYSSNFCNINLEFKVNIISFYVQFQFHIEACMQVKNLKEILIIGTNAFAQMAQMEAFVREMQTIYDVSIR